VLAGVMTRAALLAAAMLLQSGEWLTSQAGPAVAMDMCLLHPPDLPPPPPSLRTLSCRSRTSWRPV
jgi:hypothetical protein